MLLSPLGRIEGIVRKRCSMQQQPKRRMLAETAANNVDPAVSLAGQFVKLEDLIEVPFTIIGASIITSSFNDRKKAAQILLMLEDEGDDETYTLTTEQRVIMDQVKNFSEDDLAVGVGPLTITICGDKNQWGNYPYCFADYIAETPVQKAVNNLPRHKDVAEDAQRQRLGGNKVGQRFRKP